LTTPRSSENGPRPAIIVLSNAPALAEKPPASARYRGSDLVPWRDSAQWDGGACLLCLGNSDINLFRYGKGIIDLDAKVPDGAFDLCVPEQELHGAQIAGTR
jgi:hypothetical protein